MKTKISEWSTTPASNTDIDGINIAEGCAPSGINDAIRDLMAQVRSWQSGASGDPFNGPMNGTIGATTAYAGAFTTLTTSSTVTLNGGTANGVTYLNGSKVLTSGSALTFDGNRLSVSAATSRIELTTTVNTNQAYISLADADGRTAVFRGPNSGSPNVAQIGTTTNHDTAFLFGNTEQMRLTSTGLQAQKVISVGGATPAASGAGITFPATQSASSDANTLDDYEEGTFASTLLFGGTGISVYNAQGGWYTKVGNTVHFTIFIQVQQKGSATGAVTVGGLPFTSQNTNSRKYTFSVTGQSLSGLTGALFGVLNENATTINIYQTDSSGGTALTNSAFTDFSNDNLIVTGTYQV